MADDKGSPLGDLGKGIFHLYRAARKTVARLPKSKVEKAVTAKARELGRSVENVTGTLLGKEREDAEPQAVAFHANVKDGELKVAEGMIAFAVLSDLCDAVRRTKAGFGELRVLRGATRARLEVTGDFSREEQKALEALIAAVPVEKLFNVPRKKI